VLWSSHPTISGFHGSSTPGRGGGFRRAGGTAEDTLDTPFDGEPVTGGPAPGSKPSRARTFLTRLNSQRVPVASRGVSPNRVGAIAHDVGRTWLPCSVAVVPRSVFPGSAGARHTRPPDRKDWHHGLLGQ
jgi:hypothetical protein